MNEKQKMVMWGAIAAAVLCLMFPVHYYTDSWRDPNEEREFKNPQYGMTRKEWKDYLIEWNDKSLHYSDTRTSYVWPTSELIPEEHFISGQWHPANQYKKNPVRDDKVIGDIGFPTICILRIMNT